MTDCEFFSYFSDDERFSVLQTSFQRESPRRSPAQMDLCVGEGHALLGPVHVHAQSSTPGALSALWRCFVHGFAAKLKEAEPVAAWRVVVAGFSSPSPVKTTVRRPGEVEGERRMEEEGPNFFREFFKSRHLASGRDLSAYVTNFNE
ncbi:hypothetical protein NL108_017058 [Boleophthalmus pectinirostris]|nr:hypothetical protein NL108_017058 [Boleophthalmus pectinirostris]